MRPGGNIGKPDPAVVAMAGEGIPGNCANMECDGRTFGMTCKYIHI